MSWIDVVVIAMIAAFVFAIRSNGPLGGSRFRRHHRDDNLFDEDTFSRPTRSYSPSRSSGGSRSSSGGKRSSGSARHKK